MSGNGEEIEEVQDDEKPNRSGRQNWKTAHDKTVNQNKVKKIVNNFQSNTRSFLGVDSPSTLNIPTNDVTLNNWHQRTYRVLNGNRLFGGKIKEEKIEEYMEKIGEDAVDESDPFFYFKHSNGQRINDNSESVRGLCKRKFNEILDATGIKKTIEIEDTDMTKVRKII